MPSALAECPPARELPGFEAVRLWCADLDQPPPTLDRMTAFLSPDERERAAKRLGDAARRRFVVGRATLRMILGELTGTLPPRLSFAYGRDGKPELIMPRTAAPFHFNVSHARDTAVFAVAAGPVGIDVEWTEGSAPIEPVARRYFSEAERALLEAAPEADRRRLFYRIWVRKEAYLKGRGEGISQWIYATDFATSAGTSGAVPKGPVRDQDDWLMHDVEGLLPGYVASVALARAAS